MDSDDQPNQAEDELPPFNWRRTCLLVLVAWGLGFAMIWKSCPLLPWPAAALLALFLGVIAVGTMVRIF